MHSATINKLTTKDGHEFVVELGDAADVNSFFLFSLHKAGSSMLNDMFKVVCDQLSIPVFEPEIVEFSNGVLLGSLDASVQEYFVQRGFCFGGFRCYRPYLRGFDFGGFKKIFLIRDPRDMLVSHYFSHKFSHFIPKGELGKQMQEFRENLANVSIDEYVLKQAKHVRSRFEEYQTRIIDRNSRVYRYEDVVFEKVSWLRSMLAFLELSLPDTESMRIAEMFDIRPEQEDPNRHARKVTPGDHVEKLKPDTISKLNEEFAQILNEYGYAT